MLKINFKKLKNYFYIFLNKKYFKKIFMVIYANWADNIDFLICQGDLVVCGRKWSSLEGGGDQRGHKGRIETFFVNADGISSNLLACSLELIANPTIIEVVLSVK